MNCKIIEIEDDGGFHKGDSPKHFRANTEWLIEFAQFLKDCDGFYTFG